MYFLYYPFLDNVYGRSGQWDSRSFVSFARQQIQHILSRSQQSQSWLKAATLDETITDNSPGRDQVEQQTAVKVPGKVGCDALQVWYIIMHSVLRADCVIVAPVNSFLLIDDKIYCLITDLYFEKV